MQTKTQSVASAAVTPYCHLCVCVYADTDHPCCHPILSSVSVCVYADTDHPLLLVRPFLDLPKWHLEAACTEQALSWADDPTNRDTKFLRNHVRALLSQSIAPAQPQQAPYNSTPNSPPTSASHVQSNAQSIHPVHVLPPGTTRKAQDSEKQLEYSPGTAQVGVSQGPVGERSDIVDAILQVQRCCATAHRTVSSQAKELLQASLQLSLQSRQMDEAGQQQKHNWSLAVKPYAEAQPAVALHALSAVMQVTIITLPFRSRVSVTLPA